MGAIVGGWAQSGDSVARCTSGHELFHRPTSPPASPACSSIPSSPAPAWNCSEARADRNRPGPGPRLDGGGRRRRIRQPARTAAHGAGPGRSSSTTRWCCARRACWPCTWPSTRSSSRCKVRVWDDEVAGLRHGRRRGAVVQRLPGRRSCGWCASIRTTGACPACSGPAASRRPTSSATAFRCWSRAKARWTALNRRLAAAGPWRRWASSASGPNIVLAGLEAHDEDRLGVLRIAAGEEVQLRPVKPCPRCPIPNIDPATAETQPACVATRCRPTAATSASTAP